MHRALFVDPAPRLNFRTLVLLGALLALSTSSARAAMKIQGLPINNLDAQSDTYDRFNNSSSWIGNPANWSAGAPPTNNPYPWAGVGRDATLGRWATLISPSFIISASHFSPSDGDTIDFYNTNDPNGPFEQRTVIASQQLDGIDYASYAHDAPGVTGDIGDVWVGELSAPVTDIASYKILNTGFTADYNGLTIATFGLSKNIPGDATSVRLGRNVATNAQKYTSPGSAPIINSYAFQFTYDNPGVGPDESQVIEGDSGGPTFYLYGGSGPSLMGLHWANNVAPSGDPATATLSEDSMLGPYVNDIKTAMAQLSALPQSAGNTSAIFEAAHPNISTSPLRGDFNLDGKVTLADLQAMLNALKNISGYETSHGMNDAYLDYIGDFNGDFQVNAADIKGMMTLLTTGTAGGGGLTTVPEPTSCVLLGLGAITVLGMRQSWRRKAGL
jgi:hypothetical protein